MAEVVVVVVYSNIVVAAFETAGMYAHVWLLTEEPCAAMEGALSSSPDLGLFYMASSSGGSRSSSSGGGGVEE